MTAALGAAETAVKSLLANLRAAQSAVTMEWKFSNRSGWHQIHSLKKRRLFYLIPKRGDFRVAMILGDKAIASLREGPLARQTAELLKTARRYPEGTAVSFDHHSLDRELLAAVLAAKIAH